MTKPQAQVLSQDSLVLVFRKSMWIQWGLAPENKLLYLPLNINIIYG